MRLSILAGAGMALLTGIAIAAQSTLTSRAGSLIGDVRTRILTNTLGGIIAGTLMLFWLLKAGPQAWKVPPLVVGITALSGLLGILIITGISYSLQRAGIAAGLAAVIVGQLVLSTIIDTYGIAGTEQIPLTAARVIGLVLLGSGVYFMLPKA